MASPFVADFYNIKELNLLLRVLSLSLIIDAFFIVPVTLYTIRLDFKTLTKINFVAALISGGIAYYMAIVGFGVWALVGLTLIRSITTAILTWFKIKWRPNLVFSQKSLKELFSFGSNLLVSSLLNVTVNKVYDLAIPKVYSIKELGYYARGTQFADFIFAIVNSIFERVLLPGLTEVQDKTEILIGHTRRIIRAATTFVVPIFLLLAVVAEPLIRILLTDKWLPAAPIMQIFCIARLITIISGINVNLLYVVGRTDLALKQQYLKLIIRIIFLAIALKFGIIYIALAELASTILHFFINTYHPGKIMSYGASAQIKDIRFIVLSGMIMVVSIYLSTYYVNNDVIRIAMSVILGLPIYFYLIYLFKIKEFSIIMDKISSTLKNK